MVDQFLKDKFGEAYNSVSPLRELIKTNPNQIDECIELAIGIGIIAAFRRIEKDSYEEVRELVKKQLELGTRSW